MYSNDFSRFIIISGILASYAYLLNPKFFDNIINNYCYIKKDYKVTKDCKKKCNQCNHQEFKQYDEKLKEYVILKDVINNFN
tara:strand:+ start:129 stop:374 length:246 start_codon:yes stop_codon:yes gene_type:complete